jgi:thiol-disulfide isomerase/thioredoxin
MKKETLSFLFVILGLVPVKAQTARPVTISGQVSSDKDSVKLLAWFARDVIVGAGSESEKIVIPVDKNGKFSFVTPPVANIARLSVHDAYTGNKLFSQEEQFISPGDQVQCFANIHDAGAPYYFKAVFFGKGAAKYECVQALKQVNADVLDEPAAIETLIKRYDSLTNSKLTILNNFRERLSSEEYKLMMTDITGDLKTRAVTNVCGYGFGSYLYPKMAAGELDGKKNKFGLLMAHFNDTAGAAEIPTRSVTYSKYLYLKARNEAAFDNNGDPVGLKPFFQKLCEQYSGAVREKLLAMLLLNFSENYFFFGGIDPEEHQECLQKAYAMIRTDELKKRFRVYMNGLAKGAVGYNFSLPVDSSGTKKLSLSDFKGKVVLLDIWSYQCTGCTVFTQTFHRKVYPLFKDNPNFVVLSIMLGESSKAAYMRRLRGEGGAIYTYPEYINLFGGKGVAAGRKMEESYNVTAFPTILLIDKQGRIYSSTLPVIYGDPRNKELEKNVAKMSDLINKALAE